MQQLSLFSDFGIKEFSRRDVSAGIRSPLFYVGDKYKLMPQLRQLFPKNISIYYDVFCGGGSASINSGVKSVVMNDVDSRIIDLHRFLQDAAGNIEALIGTLYKTIDEYGLSLSERGVTEDLKKLKKEYKKTYFSVFNKAAYQKLREDYNQDQSRTDLLYLLLIYGYNHMIRFNSKGKFNLPVGNVDWNSNVSLALKRYALWYNTHRVELAESQDFEGFLDSRKFSRNDFLYFDPPYLITSSDYNKLWDAENERRLYAVLDYLDHKGIRWGVSNMLQHKGRKNQILMKWAKNYNTYPITSNYISSFDNSVKINSREVYVTNFKKA